MANKALLISPAQIIAESYVDENVDEKHIIDGILLCQEMYTKEILGTALYDDVMSEVLAQSLTADNTTLRDDYIRHALKWWVLYEIMDVLSIKMTNKGVLKRRSENSDPATADEILALKNKFRNIAERFDQKTRLFLVENNATYPLYYNPGNGADTIHPKGLTYGTGWFLGSSKKGLCDGLDRDG